jgi:hypothetical protein
MVEEIKIENGSGPTATQVLINDGLQMEVTVVDDAAVTWPQVPGGAFSAGTGNVVYINDRMNGTNIGFQLVNNDFNAARKQEGERVMLCKRYNLISPS